MKNKINISILVLSIFLIACNSKVKNENKQPQDKMAEELIEIIQSKIDSPAQFIEIWKSLPIRSAPVIDTTNFDNIKEVKEFNSEEIKILQLSEIYPDMNREGFNYKFLPAYKLDLSDEYYTIVLNAFKGEHELESILIIYDSDHKLSQYYNQEGKLTNNSLVIAYDEMAEGQSRKHGKIENSIITIINEFYGNTTQIDTTKFHINRDGYINQIQTKFSSDLRPGKAIQLNQIYTDTITFSSYNNDGDYWMLLGNKNEKNLRLIYNWDWQDNKQYRFNHGESIIIKWKMDGFYEAGDGETLYYSERAMDAERIQSRNVPITFLWRAEEYDEESKQNMNVIFINETFSYAISDAERAALGYVGTFIGSDCFWDGKANEDRSNLRCKILTALNLGYQCSDKHLGFLRTWFSQDTVALKKLKTCRMMPYTATVQTTFDEITIFTDKVNKTISVSYKANGMNMRESKTWSWTQTDTFKYTSKNITLINSEKSERVEKTENNNPDNPDEQ